VRLTDRSTFVCFIKVTKERIKPQGKTLLAQYAAQHTQEEQFRKLKKTFIMKKLLSISSLLVIILAVTFIACSKGGQEKASTPITYNTDAERDANSVTLARTISQDADWKALKLLNFEFLDILVKSDAPLGSYATYASNKNFEILNNPIYAAKLEEAKRLANVIKNRYFQNTAQCTTCETMTEAKWALFTEKIATFRNDKVAYENFSMKLGANSQNRELIEPLPDCNNWRFTLCGAACILTAPTGVLFAGCLLLCVAEFC
jgi:hypothetical protein